MNKTERVFSKRNRDNSVLCTFAQVLPHFGDTNDGQCADASSKREKQSGLEQWTCGKQPLKLLHRANGTTMQLRVILRSIFIHSIQLSRSKSHQRSPVSYLSETPFAAPPKSNTKLLALLYRTNVHTIFLPASLLRHSADRNNSQFGAFQ